MNFSFNEVSTFPEKENSSFFIFHSTALTSDANEKKNLTIVEGESAVISCPISSVPEVTFFWNFNNNDLKFDAGLKTKDNR